MLPALAQQHFQGTGDGFDYKLAVVPTTGTSKGLVYHSVPEFVPGPESAADAKVELFQVRVKDFEPLVERSQPVRDVHRAVPQHMPATGNRTFVNQTMTAPRVERLHPHRADVDRRPERQRELRRGPAAGGTS